MYPYNYGGCGYPVPYPVPYYGGGAWYALFIVLLILLLVFGGWWYYGYGGVTPR